MTREEIFKNLTDAEFKVYSYIQMYKETHGGREPAPEYIAAKINKSDRSIYRAYAGLRERGLIV
jgi:hypothetical protein